jgi:PAS domain S-box-containing protein
MQVPIQKSFRFRILLVSIIVEVMMLSFLIFNSVRLVDQAINDQTNVRLHSVRPLLEAALGTKLFERDYVTTVEIINRLISSEIEGFKYIIILDEQQKVFAKAGEVDESQIPRIDSDVGSAVNDGVFDTVSPLYVGNYQVGSARYGVSISSFLKSKSDLIEQGLLIAGGEIILTLIILTFTGYFLTRHIGKLIHFANRVTSGDYDASILKTSEDEFGVLSIAFQRMTKNIKLRIDELYQSEQALARSKAEFESVFNSITEAVFFVDPSRTVIMTNPSVESMFGYRPEELVGKTLEFIYLNDADYHAQAGRFSEDGSLLGEPFEVEYRRKDGTTFIGSCWVSSALCAM